MAVVSAEFTLVLFLESGTSRKMTKISRLYSYVWTKHQFQREWLQLLVHIKDEVVFALVRWLNVFKWSVMSVRNAKSANHCLSVNTALSLPLSVSNLQISIRKSTNSFNNFLDSAIWHLCDMECLDILPPSSHLTWLSVDGLLPTTCTELLVAVLVGGPQIMAPP